MNKHLLLALLCFFFVASNAYAQLFQTPLYDQPEQNCIDAIPICGNSISNDDYYIGFGEELELEPNQNCMVSGEINSVWYVFSIKQSGTLGFTINTSDDYDFSLWNITTSGCSGIAQNNPLRCNFSGNNGNTGMTAAGATNSPIGYGNNDPPFMPGINAQAGETYALLLNFLWVNPLNYDGYSINFNGSAVLNNTGGTPPSYYVDACSPDQPIIIVTNSPVNCSSIQLSDFNMNNGTVTSFDGMDCGEFTTRIQVNYTLTGNPNTATVTLSGLTDLCGNTVAGTQPLNFPTPIQLTTSATTMCEGSGDQITITSNVAGEWSNGQSGTTITVSPSATTLYTLSVANGLCSQTESVLITVFPEAYAEIIPQDAAVCNGGSAFLSVTAPAGSNITWTGGSINGANNTTTVEATPSGNTTYTASVVSPDGCPATGTTTVYTGAPAPEPQCINIYVSPSGSSGGDGSRIDPVDLPTAINMAQCNAAVIKLGVGLYNFDQAIQLFNYMTIEGGFIPANNWEKVSSDGSIATTTVINRTANGTYPYDGINGAPALMAMYGNGISSFRLQDITLRTDNAPAATQQGISTYGLYLNACSDYNIVRCRMLPGNASAGANGTNGNNGNAGANGGIGANGCSADPIGGSNCSGSIALSGIGGAGLVNSAGAGGTGANAGGNGGKGAWRTANFGNGNNNGENGQTGAGGGGTGGNGGTGNGPNGVYIYNCECDASAVSNGANGAAGNNGANGTNGNLNATAPSLGVLFLPGGAGTTATGGTNGTGGGGGGGGGGQDAQEGTNLPDPPFGGINISADLGSDAGAGGGGGGGGGTAGTGGTGGYSGGGSFGAYIWNNGANTKITDSNLTAGTAGIGGNGGTGGNGGAGGIGGAGGTNGPCAIDCPAWGYNVPFIGFVQIYPANFVPDFDNILNLTPNVENLERDYGRGGAGGNGGNGGTGGTGGNGHAGQTQNLFVNGTALVQSIINFNLSAQPVIRYSGESCVDTDITYTGPNSQSWNLGTNANPQTPSGVSVITQYTGIGRQDIGFGSQNYAGFVNIVLDDVPVAEIYTNAPPLIPTIDEFEICAGDAVNFVALQTGIDYEWQFVVQQGGPAPTPSSYPSNPANPTDMLSNIVFNNVGIYAIRHRVKSDCCGWSDWVQILLHVEPIPNFTISPSPAAVCGITDTITLTVTINNPAFVDAASYVWTPATGLSNPNGLITTVSGLSNATTYTFTAYNNAGNCYHQETVTVNVNLPIEINANVTAATCGNNGAIQLTGATNGSGNYAIDWIEPPTANGNNATNLGAGSYSVSVTDNATGCSTIGNFAVNNTVNAVQLTVGDVTPNCVATGTPTATATIQWLGGVGPYGIAWSGAASGNTTAAAGSVNATISPLATGTYTVTLTDQGNGNCTKTTTFDIVAAPPVTASVATVTNTNACGAADGSLTLNVSGGTPNTDPLMLPYNYTWSHDNTLTAASAQNLPAASYTVTITDSVGCSAVVPFSIQDPIISFTVNTPPAICAGQSITLASLNGTGTGTFVWYDAIPSQGAIVTTVNPTTNTTYWVLYTQTNCTDSASVTINIAPLQLPPITTPPPICAGTSINLSTLIGGTGTSVWYDNTPSLGNVVTTVSPTTTTTYWVLYTEGACSDSASVVLTVTPLPTLTLTQVPPICNGTTIDLSTIAPAPVVWYNGLPSAGNVVTSVTPNATTTYWAMLTQNNCSDSASLVITVNPNPDLATIANPAPICYDGAQGIDLNALSPTDNNNTNPAYTWYTDAALTTPVADPTNIITTGTYYVVAENSNGCTDSTSVVVTVNDIPAPPISLGNPNVCFEAGASAIGVEDLGLGYSLNWYDGAADGNLVGSGNPFTPASIGTYYAETINDATGCVSERTQVVITEYDALTATETGFVCSPDLQTFATIIAVDGGSYNGYVLDAAPYTATNNNDGTFTISGIATGSGATVTLFDDASCSLSVALNPQDCPCPFIAPPFTPTNSTACNGNAPASISVDDPGLGYTVNWYDAPNGGNLVGTTNPFAPASFGTYYAANTETTSGCVGEVVAVTADEAAPITYTQTNTNCSSDLTNYTTDIIPNGGAGGFVLTATASVTPNGSGGFTISNIAAGTNLNFTITDTNGCQQTGTTVAPNCNCPTINPPTGATNAQMCNGGTTVAISVAAAPAGYSIAWYNTATGGAVIATGNSFTPPAAGIYYAEMIETASGCTSTRVGVELIEASAIVVTQTDQSCALDLLTYDATISVSGGGTPNSYTITTPNATVQSLGNDEFSLGNIAAGTNINYTATDQYGCQQTGTTTAATCNCPTVNPPTGGVNAEMCNGGTTVAISVAAAPVGYSIAWYNTATGGAVIATGNSFTPPAAGIYYAEMIETASGCASSRVGVELTTASPIIIAQNNATCALDLQTYDATINVSGGGGGYTLTAAPYLVTNNGGGNFVVSGISTNTNVSLTATDQNGCTTNGTSTAPVCNCPAVPLASNGQGSTTCFGDAPNPISVSAAPAGYTVLWFDAASSGNQLATGAVYQPNNIGTYYAALQDNASLCIGQTIAVVAAENTLLSINNATPVCATDLGSYAVSGDISGGTSPYNLSATLGNVTVNADGSFDIVNLTNNINSSLTATDADGCSTAALVITAPNCNCPTIGAPTNPINNNYCFGASPTAISVDAAPAGFVINWYNLPAGGTVIASGNSFTPATAGTYYAEMLNTTTNCNSPRTTVILTQTTELVVQQGTANCAANLLSYDVSLDVSGGTASYNLTATNGLTVTNNGGNNFTVNGVPTATAATVNVVDANGCTLSATLNTVDCNCPTVAAPSNPQNAFYCFGDAPVALSVDAPAAGFSVVWYDAATGGSIVGNGNSFVPAQSGTYYAQTNQDGANCSSLRVPATLSEGNEIIITQVSQQCAADLSTYEAVFSVVGYSGAYTATATDANGNPFVVVDNGSGNVTVSGIGISATNPIFAFVDATNCPQSVAITPAVCNCGAIPSPINPQNNTYCSGSNPTDLCVTLPNASYEIRWYDSNQVLQASTPCFTPTAAGTYTATTIEVASNCESLPVTAVLTQTSPIVIDTLTAICATDLATYSYPIVVSGGTSPYNVSALPATISNNGGGNFTIDGIVSGTAANISITDANGCTANLSTNAISCNCPTIAAPVIANNALFYCADAAIPTATATPVGAGFVIHWYDAANTLVGTGSSFTPTAAGTYTALTESTTANCSSLPTTVTFTEGTAITTAVVDNLCATDLTTYDLTVSINGGQTPYTFSNTTYTITPAAGNNYVVSGIANNTNATFTITDANDCVLDANFAVVNCNCPAVTAPFTNSTAYCEGSTPTALSATAPPTDYIVTWYSQSTGGTALATGETYTPSTAGTYYAAFTNPTNNCESPRTAATLSINPVAAAPTIVAPAPYCSGAPISPLTATNTGGTITWYSDAALTNQVATGNSFTPSAPAVGTTATYYATETSAASCVSTPASVAISVVVCNCTPPAAPTTANAALTYCIGQANTSPFVANTPAGITVRWYDAANNLVGTGNSFTATTAGTYQAQAYNAAEDCAGASIPFTLTGTSVTATIDPASATITQAGSVSLTASPTNGVTYSWTPATTLNCADCGTVVASPIATTTYTVVITDQNGCTALATAFVGVENNNTVVIPNAFSPNGDNQNDVFHISGYNITTAELQVYNRWGQKVYNEAFTNLSNGWDGAFKGTDQELGVYVYYLSVTFNDGVKESYKGNVTLIR